MIMTTEVLPLVLKHLVECVQRCFIYGLFNMYFKMYFKLYIHVSVRICSSECRYPKNPEKGSIQKQNRLLLTEQHFI